MKLHVKLAAVAVVGVFATAIATSWSLIDFVDQKAQAEKQMHVTQLRRSVRALVKTQNEHWADRLANVIENVAQHSQPSEQSALGDFLAVSLLDLVKSPSPVWSEAWVESRNSKMDKDWVHRLLAQLPLERVTGNDVAWARVSTSDGQAYFSFMMGLQVKGDDGAQNKIALGVLPISAFSDVSLVAKGEKENLFVVDSQGFTYSYPDQQYVGAKISSHPIVAALIKAPRGELTGKFRELHGGSVIGGFEKVDGANIYVVATIPAEGRADWYTKFFVQLVLVTLALGGMLFMAVYFLGQKNAREIDILNQNLQMTKEVGKTETIVVDQSAERLSEFAKNVANYLRGPVSALIGNIHIAENRITDTASKESLSKATSEARHVREFVDAMVKVTGAPEPRSEVVNLNTMLNQVVSVYRSEFQRQKIQFADNLTSEVNIRAEYESLKESLKTLFAYILQRTARGSGEMSLGVRVEKRGGIAMIQIQVQGVELRAEDRRKLFLPFGSELKDGRWLGLDMALAHSAILAQNGEVKVESIGLEGFRIELYFPIVATTSEQEAAPPSQPNIAKSMGLPEKLVVSTDSAAILRPAKSEVIAKLPPAPQLETGDRSENEALLTPALSPAENKLKIQKESSIEEVVIRKPKVRFDL